ncbi:hypothetical protein AK812_SmicGene45956, partial [Symbiodinium microadriaticum]
MATVRAGLSDMARMDTPSDLSPHQLMKEINSTTCISGLRVRFMMHQMVPSHSSNAEERRQPLRRTIEKRLLRAALLLAAYVASDGAGFRSFTGSSGGVAPLQIS